MCTWIQKSYSVLLGFVFNISRSWMLELIEQSTWISWRCSLLLAVKWHWLHKSFLTVSYIILSWRQKNCSTGAESSKAKSVQCGQLFVWQSRYNKLYPSYRAIYSESILKGHRTDAILHGILTPIPTPFITSIKHFIVPTAINTRSDKL